MRRNILQCYRSVAMSQFWGILAFLVFLNMRVTGLLFKAHPRRIQLNEPNKTQWLSLRCSLNDSDAMIDVYVIEIGRSFHGKYVPIAQVTAVDGGKVVLLDKPNANRTVAHGNIVTANATRSQLNVRLTGLRCEDLTSHYCLVYYVTSSQNGIQEDRREQAVKASGVTLETSPDYTHINGHVNTTVTLRCTFFMRGSNLLHLTIGRKTSTSMTSLVAINTTRIDVVDTSLAPRIKTNGVISDKSATESWLTVTLLPVVCEDVGEYYCSAVYIVGNVTTMSEDVADVDGSCRGDRGLAVKSTTTVPPSNTDEDLSTSHTRESSVTAQFSTTSRTDIIDSDDLSKGSRTESNFRALLTILIAISVKTWRTY